MSQLLSIVIPAYREERNISYIYGELVPVLSTLEGYNYEIIFVNDGSPDKTWQEIERLCEGDTRVKWVNLSRNFGKELALFAGVENASGDAIITMDADGQRPVKTILDFIHAWESGSEIVYGVRTKMERSWIRKMFSQIFNSIMRAISSVKFDSAITDFMLLDKIVIPHLLEYRNKNIIFRWIVLDLGFHTSKVYFQEPRRLHGETAWWFWKLVKLAIDSIVTFSIFPLRLIAYLGTFVSIVATFLLMFMIVSRFFLGNPLDITNTAFFVVSNLLLSGIMLTALGIMAFYIANIHEEVIGRPLYIVKKKKNL